MVLNLMRRLQVDVYKLASQRVSLQVTCKLTSRRVSLQVDV